MQLHSLTLDTTLGILHLQAFVEDAIQVSPATRWDPPAFGTALCEGSIPWDADVPPAADEIDDCLDAVMTWTPCEIF